MTVVLSSLALAIVAFVALAFFFSALLIWMAPRPTRKVEMGAAH